MKAIENRERESAGQHQGAAVKKAKAEVHAETRSSRRESSWQTKPLEEVCNVEYGTRVVQKRDGGKGFPVYGGGGATFEMDGFNREDRLVVARFGMSEECTRFVAGKFFLNDSGLTVSPKNGAMLQRFLDYQMLALNDDIYALGKGTAQKNLDVPVFRTLPLFVPESLDEQQRIVGLLDEAFEGLATAKANAEKNLQNARALFESHLQSVFTQRGPGWVEHTLGDLIEIQNGYAFKSTDYTDAGCFVIRISNVQDGEITLANPRFIKLADKKLERFILNDGDILISLTGNIGRVGIIQEDQLPAVLNQRVARITVKDQSADRDFLFRFLLSRTFRESLQEAGHGAAQQNVSTKEIEAVRLSLPNQKEQRRIVEEFDNFAEETQRLARLYERKHAALEALKKSLLHQAFTGEL